MWEKAPMAARTKVKANAYEAMAVVARVFKLREAELREESVGVVFAIFKAESEAVDTRSQSVLALDL